MQVLQYLWLRNVTQILNKHIEIHISVKDSTQQSLYANVCEWVCVHVSECALEVNGGS